MPEIIKRPTRCETPSWEQAEVIVHLISSKDGHISPVGASAATFGPLAVFPSIGTCSWAEGGGDGSEWDVQHQPTQQLVCRVKEIDVAILVAETLWAELGAEVLDSGLKFAEIRERLPAWLLKWVKVLRVTKTWADPEPFKSGRGGNAA